MDKEIFDKLNKERQGVLNRYTWGGIVTFLATVGSLFIHPYLGLLVALLGALTTLLIGGRKKFVKDFKSLLLTSVYDSNFENCTFSFEKGFDEEYVFSTELTSHGNTYSSDDMISGEYRGIKFKRSDVNIRQVVHTGKTTTSIPIFEGQWMVFDLPKHFSSTTKVVENGFFKAGNPTGNFFNEIKVEKIETESNEFNERFSVFTTDTHDAFYLLTPQLMEKILKLEKIYDNVRLGFINNQLHVLIDSKKNNYEPSIMEEIDDSTVRSLQNQVNLIKDITDLLNIEGDETNVIMDNTDSPWSSRGTSMDQAVTATTGK